MLLITAKQQWLPYLLAPIEVKSFCAGVLHKRGGMYSGKSSKKNILLWNDNAIWPLECKGRFLNAPLWTNGSYFRIVSKNKGSLITSCTAIRMPAKLWILLRVYYIKNIRQELTPAAVLFNTGFMYCEDQITLPWIKIDNAIFAAKIF